MKTKKYKIVKNLPEPHADLLKELDSFEVIKGKAENANPKDFKLSKQLSPVKMVVWFGSITLVGVLVYVWIGIKSQIEIKGPEVTSYRSVPIKEIEPPFETFEVFSGVGDTFYTQSGSVIIIPPCKLLDSQQQEISGKVELLFRQWNNAAEIALSGVTMNYTSGGNNFLFESNGMFEIQATQNSKRLQVNPDCPCKVLLASNSLDNRFNNYFLDTIQGQWQYLEPIQVENIFPGESGANPVPAPIAPRKQIEFMDHEEAPLQTKKLPPPPQGDNTSLPDFKIVANETDFPELALYKGVLFEVEPIEAERSIPLFSKTWSNIDLVTIKSGLLYKVRMQKMNRGGSVIAADSILVHPIISDENYDEALAKYQKLEKEYRRELEQQKRKIALQKARERKKQDSLERVIEQLNKVAAENPASLHLTHSSQLDYGNLRASFTVANFGIYNSDYPIPMPSKTLVAKVKSKNNVYCAHIYQVIPAINSFMTNYQTYHNPKDGGVFTINPFYSDMEKWFVVLDKNSIAVWESTYIRKNQFESTIILKVEEAKVYRDLKSPKDAVSILLK
jgi:hypothetical protein